MPSPAFEEERGGEARRGPVGRRSETSDGDGERRRRSRVGDEARPRLHAGVARGRGEARRRPGVAVLGAGGGLWGGAAAGPSPPRSSSSRGGRGARGMGEVRLDPDWIGRGGVWSGWG